MVSVTDAHVHVVSSDTERFPLRPGGPGRDWWTDRAVDGPAITRDLDDVGVDRAVIVQAVGPYRNDNRYAQRVVAESGGRYALVVAIDPDADDPATELATLVSGGGVAGVRVAAFTNDAEWMNDGRGPAIWAAAAERGVNLVVACQAQHLPRVARLVSGAPSVAVALDHCAFPDLGGGPPYTAAAPLLELAAMHAISLKVSTITLTAAQSAGGARALVTHLVDAYGANRVCWGSDHPQTYEVGYDQMLQLAMDATTGLDTAARAAVLDETARALWFGGD